MFRLSSPIMIPVVAMITVVVVSNFLVQFPINHWLTWGAFSFPFAFLVTDLTNRALGAERARRVVYTGFIFAVALSAILSDLRIALASGAAFLFGQVLDISIFDKLRNKAWWFAPLTSSLIASFLDSVLFFSLAFSFSNLPWLTWATGDYVVKVTMAALLLIPYRALLRSIKPISL